MDKRNKLPVHCVSRSPAQLSACNGCRASFAWYSWASVADERAQGDRQRLNVFEEEGVDLGAEDQDDSSVEEEEKENRGHADLPGVRRQGVANVEREKGS